MVHKMSFCLAASAVLLSAASISVYAQAPAKPLRVGISSPEANNPFHVQLARSIAATLKERGIDSLLLSANADINAQVNNIGDLLSAKVDAILVAPLDEEGAAPAITRAKAAGIPVFMYARTLDAKYAPLWISFVGMDAVAVGTDKGQWLVKNSKPGKVAMLLGPAAAAPMVEQEKGFRKAIESAGYKVVFNQPSTMTRENGIKLAEDALVANKDLVAIYAANDDLALGAGQAVKAAGLKGKVAVIGMNGSPAALAAVHNGDMAATVLLDPMAWGQTSANMVADFLLKKQAPAKFVPMKHRIVVQAEAFDLVPPPLRERLGVTR